jgi:hypothetical protein
MNVNDDLEKLIENLPFFFQEQLNLHSDKEQLIVLDLGRRPEAFPFIKWLIFISKIISWQDIDYTAETY